MRRRLYPLGLLLPVALLAAGCGIRATDVVEVGDAAVVQVAPGSTSGAILYFVFDGELRPVSRLFAIGPDDGPGAEAGPESGRAGKDGTEALVMLLEGPDEPERQAGLRTELPSGTVGVMLDLTESGVVVRLKSPVTGFSDLACGQLVCTAAEAVAPGGGEPVTVKGPDGSFGPDVCTP